MFIIAIAGIMYIYQFKYVAFLVIIYLDCKVLCYNLLIIIVNNTISSNAIFVVLKQVGVLYRTPYECDVFLNYFSMLLMLFTHTQGYHHGGYLLLGDRAPPFAPTKMAEVKV